VTDDELREFIATTVQAAVNAVLQPGQAADTTGAPMGEDGGITQQSLDFVAAYSNALHRSVARLDDALRSRMTSNLPITNSELRLHAQLARSCVAGVAIENRRAVLRQLPRIIRYDDLAI
jgi:hypothetical protein